MVEAKNFGKVVEQCQYKDIKDKYPFEKIRGILNRETEYVHFLPVDVFFEDGIEDMDDFEVTLYEIDEIREDGQYKLYTLFDEGGNMAQFDVFEGKEDV